MEIKEAVTTEYNPCVHGLQKTRLHPENPHAVQPAARKWD